MKLWSMTTGICTVLVIAAILIAGCTSSPDVPAPDTGAIPQVTRSIAPAPAENDNSPQLTETIVQAPVSDQGVRLDSDSTTGADAAAVNDNTYGIDAATASADAAVDPFNSTSQPATMVPDSANIGDPIP